MQSACHHSQRRSTICIAEVLSMAASNRGTQPLPAPWSRYQRIGHGKIVPVSKHGPVQSCRLSRRCCTGRAAFADVPSATGCHAIRMTIYPRSLMSPSDAFFRYGVPFLQLLCCRVCRIRTTLFVLIVSVCNMRSLAPWLSDLVIQCFSFLIHTDVCDFSVWIGCF